jgi:Asp-tRNA(Asn)/Glu-tRNA(Gln) amidotransferase A subunit family amidase
MNKKGLTRKEFLHTGALTVAGTLAAGLPLGALAAEPVASPQAPPIPAPDTTGITVEDLAASNKLSGVNLTAEERKSVLEDVQNFRHAYDSLRKQPITNAVSPSLLFTPLNGGSTANPKIKVKTSAVKLPPRTSLTDEDLAFLSVRELGHLLRAKQVTSVELTKLYLGRLQKHGDQLLCLITLTDDLALKQAAQADEELAHGHNRGPLHGIPYGIKDLFAAKGYPTTWGANTFEHQSFDYDSAVVEKLREAGAILCAKLSMGALAQDDVWFKGRTHNPWNPKEGSSGSSAGSACAMASGLVAFTIGTETLGSIVSPSVQCRVTGLRPTFGRVSRFGAMELSWTMDKAGPICRDVEDTALVLAAICGHDPRDPSSVSRPLTYAPRKDLKGLKIGVLEGRGASATPDPLLARLEKLGATVKLISFAPVPNGIENILDVDCGSAFDEFTRSGLVRELKESAWPETFRASRFVTAVEYLQAQRARTLLLHHLEEQFSDLDAYVGHDGAWQTLVHTNFTGHPQLVIPQAPDAENRSHSVSIVGRLYEEGTILAIGRLLQEQDDFHRRRPKL